MCSQSYNLKYRNAAVSYRDSQVEEEGEEAGRYAVYIAVFWYG